MRVLILEDETLMAEAIRDGLRLAAIAADIAPDGDVALELLSYNAYDVAVLDRDVPGPSGDEVAESIVAGGSGTAILMLTAADRLDDKQTGFESGADDYLTKPFAMRELVLRLRALARRSARDAARARTRRGARRPVPPGSLSRREVRPAHPQAVRRPRGADRRRRGSRQCRGAPRARLGRERGSLHERRGITVSALRKRLGEPWIIATVPGVGYRVDDGP